MHSADVIQMLEEDGWLVVKVIAPNLSIFHHPVKSGQVMLPHPLVLPVGTVQSIRDVADLP